MKKSIVLAATALLISGCSVFGDSGVESAPYTVLKAKDETGVEVRNYDSMILVSTAMNSNSQGSAFRRLFNYISGQNSGEREIAMTAPVFMGEEAKDSGVDEGVEIAMTAPVFMQNDADEPVMSFVMPASFTMETTPVPTNDEVWISEVKNYQVAAIEFSGTLSDSNIDEATTQLEMWMLNNGYEAAGRPITAGYNGPFTIPMFRKNEILIEIKN